MPYLKFENYRISFLIRSAYGIGNTASPSFCSHDSCFDCLITNFCYCCSVNQMYQTVKSRGPASPTAGFSSNQTPFNPVNKIFDGVSCFEGCFNLLYTVFCPCFKVGNILENSVGMPWCMGCCCVPLFTARNIVRYQYRLSPVIKQSLCECWPTSNEFVEECVWPSLLYYTGQALSSLTFGATLIVVWAYEVGVILSLGKEVSLRKDKNQRTYLIGFEPQH